MSWITAILQLYSQVADLFENVIVKHKNIRLFDLLARFHYILNLSRTIILILFRRYFLDKVGIMYVCMYVCMYEALKTKERLDTFSKYNVVKRVGL